jgi:hypothetical protein
LQETVEQYKRRMMGYLGSQDPMRVQARTVAAIEKLLKGVPSAKLKKRPAQGKWSIAEILAHLADDELVVAYRMKCILAASGTPVAAFDQDRWAEAMNYGKTDAKMSLRVLRTLRDANLALLKSLRTGQWNNFGIHTERGEESIERIVQMTAGHDINHLRQVEAILKSKKGSPGS